METNGPKSVKPKKIGSKSQRRVNLLEGGGQKGIKPTGVKHGLTVVTFLRIFCKHKFIFTLLRTCSCIVVKIYSISFFFTTFTTHNSVTILQNPNGHDIVAAQNLPLLGRGFSFEMTLTISSSI